MFVCKKYSICGTLIAFTKAICSTNTNIVYFTTISISSLRSYSSSIQNHQIMYVWLQTRDSITDKSAPEFYKSIYLTICAAYFVICIV